MLIQSFWSKFQIHYNDLFEFRLFISVNMIKVGLLKKQFEVKHVSLNRFHKAKKKKKVLDHHNVDFKLSVNHVNIGLLFSQVLYTSTVVSLPFIRPDFRCRENEILLPVICPPKAIIILTTTI